MTIGLLARHRRVGIDSNVLIYLLEGSGTLADASGALLDAIAAGEAEVPGWVVWPGSAVWPGCCVPG